jgi:hypothetical protein
MPTDSEIQTDNPKVRWTVRDVLQLICGNLQILMSCDQTCVQMWGLFCRCFKILWASGPPVAEAITCLPLHVEFALDEVAMGQEFPLVHRCYQHHSTSAPYSCVIRLVLTVYHLSNCQCNRNISPSLGKDAKNYDVVVKTAETVTCTSHVTNLTLMFRPSCCKVPAEAIWYYWQDETSPLPYLFRTVSLAGAFWGHAEETWQDSFIVSESAEPHRIRRHL